MARFSFTNVEQKVGERALEGTGTLLLLRGGFDDDYEAVGCWAKLYVPGESDSAAANRWRLERGIFDESIAESWSVTRNGEVEIAAIPDEGRLSYFLNCALPEELWRSFQSSLRLWLPAPRLRIEVRALFAEPLCDWAAHPISEHYGISRDGHIVPQREVVSSGRGYRYLVPNAPEIVLCADFERELAH